VITRKFSCGSGCSFYHAIHVEGLNRGYTCLARPGEEPEGCPMVKPAIDEDHLHIHCPSCHACVPIVVGGYEVCDKYDNQLGRTAQQVESCVGCPFYHPNKKACGWLESWKDLTKELHRLRAELLREVGRTERAEKEIKDRAEAEREGFYVAIRDGAEFKLVKCARCRKCGNINDMRLVSCSWIHKK